MPPGARHLPKQIMENSNKKNHGASAGSGTKTIALNKRARFEYFIEERFEAGIALEGWEVKSLRDGRVQFGDSYVLLKNGEAFLFGCQISPLPTVSTHIVPDPLRTRKLLLHRREIDALTGAVERKRNTLVPTAMYWSKSKAKVEIGLAKGKKSYDKRQDLATRDAQKEINKAMGRRSKGMN